VKEKLKGIEELIKSSNTYLRALKENREKERVNI
jgi:hypothetical protein